MALQGLLRLWSFISPSICDSLTLKFFGTYCMPSLGSTTELQPLRREGEKSNIGGGGGGGWVNARGTLCS